MEELADKLLWVSFKPFLFLNHFLFLLFSSSVSPFVASATALNKSAMLRITVCCDLTRSRVWSVKEQVYQRFEVYQHEFANLSLPCEDG